MISTSDLTEIRLAEGRLYCHVCPDCGEINGGGIENEKHAAGRPHDPYSPINTPCIWCGKGPMVIRYSDEPEEVDQ